MQSKKSSLLSLESLVRIGGSLLFIFLVVFPLLDKGYSYFITRKYVGSYNNLVSGINKMSIPREEFTLSLKEKSALIGFSRNSERYECIKCYSTNERAPDRVFIKPNNEFCNGNACICLCYDGFIQTRGTLEGQATVFGQCQGQFVCKKLENIDIARQTLIKVTGGTKGYWKNGFLFVSGDDLANGLQKHGDTTLIVERIGNTIGVCNYEILDLHKKLGLGNSCIITNEEGE